MAFEDVSCACLTAGLIPSSCARSWRRGIRGLRGRWMGVWNWVLHVLVVGCLDVVDDCCQVSACKVWGRW